MTISSQDPHKVKVHSVIQLMKADQLIFATFRDKNNFTLFTREHLLHLSLISIHEQQQVFSILHYLLSKGRKREKPVS